jgi:hypothetical protein
MHRQRDPSASASIPDRPDTYSNPVNGSVISPYVSPVADDSPAASLA